MIFSLKTNTVYLRDLNAHTHITFVLFITSIILLPLSEIVYCHMLFVVVLNFNNCIIVTSLKRINQDTLLNSSDNIRGIAF